MGAALQSIGYIGDGPNTFKEFPISAHFEIHCEQQTKLEKAGKPVGWVEGWQGIDYYEITLTGVDGHANTYDMKGRRDSLIGASKIMLELQSLALAHDGITTVTNIKSGPIGACNVRILAMIADTRADLAPRSNLGPRSSSVWPMLTMLD